MNSSRGALFDPWLIHLPWWWFMFPLLLCWVSKGLLKWFLKLARWSGLCPKRLLTSPSSGWLCYLSVDLYSESWVSAHTHFFHTDLLCSGTLNINTWALARKITVFSCLCHWATPVEQLLKGSSAQADEWGQSASHSISVLSEDWDPADQSHEQITINKLNGEPQRLGVLENNDERQAFRKRKDT